MNPREMTATDRRFVVPTWAQSSHYEGLSKDERFKLVDRIIDGGARVIVLANDRTVHVWAAGDGESLHYVYVPPKLRGFGLARKAITALLGSYPAHITTTHPWPRESARFRFAPYVLLRRAA